MFTGRYEFAKTTQRMVMLVHRTTAIRNSPCPYVYVTKEQHAEMGGVLTWNPDEGVWTSPQLFDIEIRMVE